MKITNKLNLPQALVDAVSVNTRDPTTVGDISITELLSPPRLVALRKHFADKLEEDVSERIWSLLGQIGHGILERANKTDIVETRFYAGFQGWMVSGQTDSFTLEEGVLTDYKFITVYKVKDGCPQEYEEQLNCYVTLMQMSGLKVDKAQIVAILRDWSKLQAKREPGYPQNQVVVLDVPIRPFNERHEFISERVKMHQEAQATLAANGQTSLVKCTDEERWKAPPAYAVMKQGQKRAVKLFPNPEAAQSFIGASSDGAKLSIDVRIGIPQRCSSYCPVSDFCTQWQEDPDNMSNLMKGITEE